MTIINLIVGLGNPGKEYESTRHNVGFWALDELAASYSLNWTFEKTFFAHIAKIKQDAITTYLLKPQTFMNRSGLAVGTFAKYHKIPSDSIYVIHDELDLLPGQLKRKQGGSNAGHNGLKDIQKALGTPDFWRFRLGIGHPRTLNLSQNVADFVLHPPKNTDKELILESIALSLVDCHSLIAGKPPSSNRSTP